MWRPTLASFDGSDSEARDAGARPLQRPRAIGLPKVACLVVCAGTSGLITGGPTGRFLQQRWHNCLDLLLAGVPTEPLHTLTEPLHTLTGLETAVTGAKSRDTGTRDKGDH